MNAEEITKLIEESFKDVAYPGDYNVFGLIYDPGTPTFEILLLGRTWKEVWKVLDRLGDQLFYYHVSNRIHDEPSHFYHLLFSWMAPEVLHYYAPAFLTISLDQKSDIVADCFFRRLDPRAEEDHRFSDFTRFVNLLSERQKHAVALTEDFRFSDKHSALHLFWSRWL